MNHAQTFEAEEQSTASGRAMRAALDHEGVFVLRGLLSEVEIHRLRGQVSARLQQGGRRLALGRTQPGAAILPELGWALAHPKIVAVFRAILGADGLLFTGHCDIHRNVVSGWHKDSGETYGGYFTGDYFAADECRVYKAAIYLQDAGERDALRVRLGSHRDPDLHAGREAKLRTRAGDVVFFDVRLNHCGQLPDRVERGIKVLAKLATGGSRAKEEPVWVSRLRETYMRARGREDRLSVFFTYGAANRFTEEFAAANMRRQLRQAGEPEASLPPGLVRALEEQGVPLCEAARDPARDPGGARSER